MPNKATIHRTGRDRVVTELLKARAAGLQLDGTLYAIAAESSGYSKRQLQRLIAHHDRINADPEFRKQTKDHWLEDPDVITMIALCTGNLANAHKQLEKAGKKVPSLSTFKRRINASIGSYGLTLIRHGDAEARSRRMYLRREPGQRGHTYETDHTECPIYVIPNGYYRAHRPFITVVMDHATRYVLSVVITFGTPSAEEVRVAFIAAILDRNAADGCTRVGGLPSQIVWDQGKEFLSGLVTESCLRLGTTPFPLPAYSPHLKGRLERFWRFFKENCLACMPGYIDAGADIAGNLQRAQHALTETAFVERVQAWIDWYNSEHVNRSLRSTPLQAWQSDPRDLVTVPADQLWQDFLLSSDRYTVTREGISIKGVNYVTLNGELGNLGGRKVEVRYLPHTRHFIEVFHQGRHIGTAYPFDSLTPDDREQFMRTRRADEERARKNISSVKRLHKNDPDTTKLNKKKLPGGKYGYEIDVPDDALQVGQDDALSSYQPRSIDHDGFDENGQGVLV